MTGTVRWSLVLCLLAATAVPSGGQQTRELRVGMVGGQGFSVALRADRRYAVIPVSAFQRLGWTVRTSADAAELVGPNGARIRVVGGSPVVEWGEGELLQLAQTPYFADGELMVPLQVVVELLPRQLPDEYAFDGPSMTLWVLAEEGRDALSLDEPGDPAQADPVSVEAPSSSDGLLRLHLECQGFGCWDVDHFRGEIPTVDWVDDREGSDLHVLVTARATTGGNVEYTLAFTGLRAYEGQDQNLFVNTPGGASDADIRSAVGQRLQVGLAGYLVSAPAADRPEVSPVDAGRDRQVVAGRSRPPKSLAFSAGPVFPVYPYLVKEPWRIGVGGTLRVGLPLGRRASLRLAGAYSHLVFDSQGFFGALPTELQESVSVDLGEESAAVATGSGELALALRDPNASIRPLLYLGAGIGRMSLVRVPMPGDLTWTTLRRSHTFGPMASGGSELSISAGPLAVILSADYSIIFLTTWGRRGYPQFVRFSLGFSNSSRIP